MAKIVISEGPFVDHSSLPRSREGAKDAGSKYYFSGPCSNGHNSPRYVSIGRCVACQAAAIARLINKDPELAKKKARDRYSSNKDIVRAKVKKWYSETAGERRAYAKERLAKKRDHIRKIRRDWVAKNKEKDRVWQRQKRKKHKDKIAVYNKKYKINNRHIYASAQKARQTLQLRAMPAWVDRAAIDRIYAEANRLTKDTGVRHSVDHIYPLKGKTSCGLHVPWNLQILTLRENIQKSNASPEEWRRQSESATS